jgi:hypothetical protein
MLIIDQNKVHRRMINLPYGQWPVSVRIGAAYRFEPIPRDFAAAAVTQCRSRRQLVDTIAYGIGMWRAEFGVATASLNLNGAAPHRGLLLAQVTVFDSGINDGIDFWC